MEGNFVNCLMYVEPLTQAITQPFHVFRQFPERNIAHYVVPRIFGRNVISKERRVKTVLQLHGISKRYFLRRVWSKIRPAKRHKIATSVVFLLTIRRCADIPDSLRVLNVRYHSSHDQGNRQQLELGYQKGPSSTVFVEEH